MHTIPENASEKILFRSKRQRTLFAVTGAVTAVLCCLMKIKCTSARLMSVADGSVTSVRTYFAEHVLHLQFTEKTNHVPLFCLGL